MKVTSEEIVEFSKRMRASKKKYILLVLEKEKTFCGVSGNSKELAEMLFTTLMQDEDMFSTFAGTLAMVSIQKTKDKIEFAVVKQKSGVN